jgi:DNA polymerase-3 subunit gamma/tau
MTETLYRKYRPQTFADVAGQKAIKLTLQNEIANDRVAHAYLFCGPRAVGKTTTARLLAKSLNCLHRATGESEPCNGCASCEEINAGRSLDLIEVDAASHTGVDHVREHIIENSRIAPTSRKYKVFIIDEAHMLSISAFNALLKTLEEPPHHVVFILATTEVHKLPATIISRCQRFDFHRIEVGEMIARLEKIAGAEGIQVEREVLESIARHAQGHERDAEGLLGQIFAIGEKKITTEIADLIVPRLEIEHFLTLFRLLQERNAPEAIERVNQLLDEGVDLDLFHRSWIEFLRWAILLRLSPSLSAHSTVSLGEKQYAEFLDLVKLVAPVTLIQWMQHFLQTQEIVRHALQLPQLPLELAILESIPSENEKEEPRRPPQSVTTTHPPSVSTEPKPVFSKKTAATASSSITLEEIKAQWPAILSMLQETNHSLTLALNIGKLVSFENDCLTLGFGYQFHCKILSENQNQDALMRVIEKVTGHRILVKGIVEEHARQPEDSPVVTITDPQINAALEALGGRVVG